MAGWPGSPATSEDLDSMKTQYYAAASLDRFIATEDVKARPCFTRHQPGPARVLTMKVPRPSVTLAFRIREDE